MFIKTTAALNTVMSFSMRSVLMASAQVSFHIILFSIYGQMPRFTPGNPPLIIPPLAVPYMVFLRLLSCFSAFWRVHGESWRRPHRHLVGLRVMGLQGHSHLLLSGIVLYCLFVVGTCSAVVCLTICLFLFTGWEIEAYVGFSVLIEWACWSRDVLSSVILFQVHHIS